MLYEAYERDTRLPVTPVARLLHSIRPQAHVLVYRNVPAVLAHASFLCGRLRAATAYQDATGMPYLDILFTGVSYDCFWLYSAASTGAPE